MSVVKSFSSKVQKGSGRKDIIRQFVRGLSRAGVMDSMILSYHENGAMMTAIEGLCSMCFHRGERTEKIL